MTTGTIDLHDPRPQRIVVVPPDPAVFSAAALAAAAPELPEDLVATHRAVDIPMLLELGSVDRGAGPARPVIDDLAGSESWVMLAGMGTLASHRAAMLSLTLPVQRAAQASGQRVVGLDLIVFLGAPRTRVPFHCDKAHHLLFQVVGTKRLVVGWYDDPEVAAAVRMASVGDWRRNPVVVPDRTEEVVLTPGDAVVIPAFVFHGVAESDGPSVAAAGVVRTDLTEATEADLRAAGRAAGLDRS